MGVHFPLAAFAHRIAADPAVLGDLHFVMSFGRHVTSGMGAGRPRPWRSSAALECASRSGDESSTIDVVPLSVSPRSENARYARERCATMSRRTYLLGTCGAIIVGILSRVGETGWPLIDKYAGDALYAVMLYTLLGAVAVKAAPASKGITILLLMIAIEGFQLTNIAATLSHSSNVLLRIIARLLGTTFSWWDILAYVVGLLLIVAVDMVVARARRKRRHSGRPRSY